MALCAVLAALALGLSTLENLFPVTALVPVPGVKLGLANIVTVFALYRLGAPEALAILLVRCALGGLFAGNVSALLFSTLGGLWQLLMGTALVPLEYVWRNILLYSLAGGAIVGGFGSMFSIRKHLNV